MNHILLVSIGGMAGAITRYFVHKTFFNKKFPVTTLFVNLLGAFLLGWLFGKGIKGSLYFLGGIGFLGAFTTFSTLNVEMVSMLQEKKLKKAIMYACFTYFIGLLCSAVGLYVGRL